MGEVTNNWTTTVRQHPERSVPHRAQEFLAQGQVAHVGFEYDGRPYVIPSSTITPPIAPTASTFTSDSPAAPCSNWLRAFRSV